MNERVETELGSLLQGRTVRLRPIEQTTSHPWLG